MGAMISCAMAIFGGVVVALIVAEIDASTTVVAKWLIGIAASRLPNKQRAGVQAEWMSHLNEEPTAEKCCTPLDAFGTHPVSQKNSPIAPR
jgi:hypothetical protein